MKILLLADMPGWIVDRLCARMVQEMLEIEWKTGYYGCMTTDEILTEAADCDLIHYGNWDIERHWPRILEAGKPLLVSVRSHRYPASFRDEVAPLVKIHAVSPSIRDAFPGSVYIPDGLMIDPEPLRVGFVGKPGAYKGSDMIEQACEQIDAEFFDATGQVEPIGMRQWYFDIDVLCCASLNEGFGTPVMEALALNKPVVSTRCGAACESELPGVTWVDRSVDGIAEGLLKHWPARNLNSFAWSVVADQFRGLYKEMVQC